MYVLISHFACRLSWFLTFLQYTTSVLLILKFNFLFWAQSAIFAKKVLVISFSPLYVLCLMFTATSSTKVIMCISVVSNRQILFIYIFHNDASSF